MANRRRNVGLAIALALSLVAGPALASSGQAAQATDRRAEIRAALSSVGAYVANVLVTPSGFARSDYDLMDGRWRDYEPHWHAGQQMLGLLHAHRLTGEPRLLRAATRAGRWWVGTEFKALSHSDEIDAMLASLRPEATTGPDLALLPKIHNSDAC